MLALKHPKVLELEDFLPTLEALRRSAKKIVFTNGCFDIIHPGHVDLLARARAFGDVLVIGLNGDRSVRRLSKGAGRPFNPYTARAFVLAHLESVNHIIRFSEDTPLELIKQIRPNVLVKGGDYNLDSIVGRDIVENAGGVVYALPLIDGWSTTRLAQRIVSAARGIEA